jgi:hypothetical protein
MPHRFDANDSFAGGNDNVRSFMRAVAVVAQTPKLTQVSHQEEKDFLAQVAWPVEAAAFDREAQIRALQRFVELTSGEEGIKMVLHFRTWRDKLMVKYAAEGLSKGLAMLVLLHPKKGRTGVLTDCFKPETTPESLRDPQLQKMAGGLIERVLTLKA